MWDVVEQPTFWDSDSFDAKRYGRQLAPNRCHLGGGSVWDVVVQATFWDSDSFDAKRYGRQLTLPTWRRVGVGRCLATHLLGQ